MKKSIRLVLVFCLSLLAVLPLHAQDIPLRTDQSEIKTLLGSSSHTGAYLAGSFQGMRFKEKEMFMVGGRLAFVINRSLGIGAEGFGIVPTGSYTDLSVPGEFNVTGGYGGLFLEPIFFSNQAIHLTFPTGFGAGWMGYIRDWESSYSGDPLLDGDMFWYVEPRGNIEINLSKAFRLDLGAAYRFTQDLSLLDTAPKAFNGWNFYLQLKLGGF